MDVAEWLCVAPIDSGGRRDVAVLGDGGRISIQARRGAYSTPEDVQGPHTAVEVMLDGPAPASWAPFAEDGGGPYGWVPIGLVTSYVAGRGGIEGPGTWRRYPVSSRAGAS